MKTLISADMEGVCGLVSWSQVFSPAAGARLGFPTSADYEWARQLLMEEVNAAVAGAYEGGATEVFVNEAHDGAINLRPHELHPGARLISGFSKPLSAVQGIERGIGALILVGWHAAANTPGAVLAHTYSFTISELRLNGRRVGEMGFFGALAGHFGVPVAMVTGDDKAIQEAVAVFGAGLVGVVVKESLSMDSAVHIAATEARSLIRAGAQKAVRAATQRAPLKMSTPVRMEIDWANVCQADQAEVLPGAERIGPRSIAYVAADMPNIAQAFLALTRLVDRC